MKKIKVVDGTGRVEEIHVPEDDDMDKVNNMEPQDAIMELLRITNKSKEKENAIHNTKRT